MKKQLLIIASLFALTASTQAQLSFDPAVHYGAGTNPNSITSADFNGDGKKDLALTNLGGNNVSVLFGNGFGSFSTAVSYSVGATPRCVTSGDFNNDGYADIASSNSFGNNVSILLGSSSGTFAPSINYLAGASPYALISGDFNGDGNADLAVANQTGNNISILLGNGTGSFAAPINYAAGTTPVSVTTADFNSDGNLDLAVTLYGSSDIAIMFGSGTGTFAAPIIKGVLSPSFEIAAADFNNDNKPDLVIAGDYNGVYVFINSGTGTFGPVTSYFSGSVVYSVFPADYNGDGKIDIASTNASGNTVSILLGSGTGTFAAPVTYGVGTSPRRVVSADFNGDSKPDLGTANSTSNNASVLLNTNASALHFDGNNDYVNIGNSLNTTLSTSNKITVEAWVKPTSNSGIGCIVGNYNTFPSTTGVMQFALRRDGANYSFWADNGSGYTNVSSAATVTLGVWQHVAGTWDGSNLLIYVNGVLSGTTTYTGTSIATNSQDIWIGRNGSGENYTGTIDEVRIWNTTRNQCQINAYKNCEIQTTANNLIANYHFYQGFPSGNNTTITNLNDASISAATGTLTNFALTGSTSNWVALGGVVSNSITPANVNVGATVSSSVLCLGENTTLSGTGATTYTWSGGITNASAFTPTVTGTYTVTGAPVFFSGCTNTAVVTVTVNELPILNIASSNTLLCAGESVTLTASGASTYLWNFNEIGNQYTDVLFANQVIYIVGTNTLTACSSTVAFTQSVTACTGIMEAQELNSISLQPNPASTYFTLNNVLDGTIVNVIDVTGKVVISDSVIDADKTMTIETSNLSNGIYIIQLKNNGAVAQKKLVVSK